MTAMTCEEVLELGPAFVLGALERDEELAVAEHVRSCPHGQAELAEFARLGAVVPALLESVPLVEPPASLRDRIRAAAARDLDERQSTASPPAQAERATVVALAPERAIATEGATVVPIEAARSRRRNPLAWGLAAAAAIVILGLGAATISTQQQLADARSYQQKLTAALVQAGQPGSQVAVITSTGAPGSGPGGIAVMPASGTGTLVMSGLAPTSGSQVYEAWAITEGQPPVPVAGFTVGPDGVGYVNAMPEASGQPVTVAITLEPAPNPTAPSSAPIAAGVAPPPEAPG